MTGLTCKAVIYRELLGLCQTVKKYDAVAAAHVRGDNEEALEAFNEFIQIGRETGGKIHLSHIGSMAAFGQMRAALELFMARWKRYAD